jgi:hypothetical protein
MTTTPPLKSTTAAPGAHDRMSRPEAARHLLDLAKHNAVTIEQIDALQIAVTRIAAKHIQACRNRLRRKAEKQS